MRFKSGLGHLARRSEAAWFVPVAVEYSFWEEKLPEVLVTFGEPLWMTNASARAESPDFWTGLLEYRLQTALDNLACAAQRRNSADWTHLLRGSAGVGVVYDSWRALKALYRGESYSREHGRL